MSTSAEREQEIGKVGNELTSTFESFALPRLPPGRPFKDIDSITKVAAETSKLRAEVELNVIKTLNGLQILKELSDILLQVEESSSGNLTGKDEITAKKKNTLT